MLTKISRKNCLKKIPWMPHTSLNRNKIYFPKTYGNYTLTVDVKFIRDYINTFSKEFEKLVQILELGPLIFIGDNGLPWLYQKHDYSKVKSVIAYLKQNKITKKFNGGLLVNKEELAEFTTHLFWLTRCCAALPYFHFADKHENVCGYICKFGNVHLYTINKGFNRKISAALKSSAFIPIPEMSCYNKFGKTGAIRNRRTIV